MKIDDKIKIDLKCLGELNTELVSRFRLKIMLTVKGYECFFLPQFLLFFGENIIKLFKYNSKINIIFKQKKQH
jgi:hypothetical protein